MLLLREIFREFVELYLKYTLAWLECERNFETISSSHDNNNQHHSIRESLLQIYYTRSIFLETMDKFHVFFLILRIFFKLEVSHNPQYHIGRLRISLKNAICQDKYKKFKEHKHFYKFKENQKFVNFWTFKILWIH